MTELTERKIRMNLSGLFLIISVFLMYWSQGGLAILFFPFGVYFIFKKITHPKDRVLSIENIDGTLNLNNQRYYNLYKDNEEEKIKLSIEEIHNIIKKAKN
jgi:hypothetical protein